MKSDRLKVGRGARTARVGRASLALLALLVLLGSCATSRGSTYSSGRGDEAAAAKKAAAARQNGRPSSPPPSPAPRPSPTYPAPSSPYHPSDDESGGGIGSLILSIIFDSAKPPPPPPAPMGVVALRGLGPEDRIYLDGMRQFGFEFRATAGPHEIRVERFGYRDFVSSLMVYEDKLLELEASFVPAPFEIRAVRAEPAVFDPSDPGVLGSSSITILLSAPGDVEVEVLDERGRSVRELGEAARDGEGLRLRWDGLDDRDRVLPPGLYEIHASGKGREGGKSESKAYVRILAGRFSRSASLFTGLSGLLFAPDARTIERGGFELQSGFIGHVEPAVGSYLGRATGHVGMRFGPMASNGPFDTGLGFRATGGESPEMPESRSSSWEAAFSGMYVLHPGENANPSTDSFAVSAALKFTMIDESGLAAAFFARGTLASFADETIQGIPPSWDGATRFSGLSAGLPLEYGVGRARLLLAPEVQVSGYYPLWGSGLWEVPGFFSWAYLRAGVEYTLGDITMGLSGALRSRPFGSGWEPSMPVALGFEARWHSPDSPFVLSFLATGEYESLYRYYIGAGVGAGLRF